MPKSATKLQGENFAPKKKFAPVFSPISESEAAEEFSAVILDFSVGELAAATGRSKETAKCWQKARAFPNGVSLMALVAKFPRVSAWFDAKTGHPESPRGLTMAFEMLEKIMSSNTPEARAMRARLEQLLNEERHE